MNDCVAATQHLLGLLSLSLLRVLWQAKNTSRRAGNTRRLTPPWPPTLRAGRVTYVLCERSVVVVVLLLANKTQRPRGEELTGEREESEENSRSSTLAATAAAAAACHL